MPTAYFEDIVRIKITDRETLYAIDRVYMDVCEPNSIEVTSAVPSDPCILGAKVQNNIVHITIDSFHNNLPEYVVIKLAGVRLGRLGNRFPVFSKEEMDSNTRFWSQWKTQ